jgi:hypothetical protein
MLLVLLVSDEVIFYGLCFIVDAPNSLCNKLHCVHCDAGASLTKSSEPVRGGKGTAGERQHSNFGNIELDCAKH